MFAVLLLLSCKEASAPPGSAIPAGEWRSFEGTWSAAGDVRAIETERDRQAAVFDLSGSILIVGQRGIGAGFQARAVTYSDGTANNVGRAVWTDDRGDRIFSELHGAPVASGQRVTGTFTGGTGRWRGISGEYVLDWQYVVDAGGRISGRSENVRGRARILPPGERR